ncbi:MAG: hypothetical protein IPI52_14380 [Bacteroidetes bacterium]|nr:hypothetical protein [Bacteroidota bacterium]
MKIPSPENCRTIEAPENYGVYQIKNFKTKEFIQFGESKVCQFRMQSLFPKPCRGTNNEDKRIYIQTTKIGNRTIKAESKEEAVRL